MEKYSINDLVVGMVTGIEKYGIFLVFDDKSSGLIHISEISDSYVSNVNEHAKIGESLKVKVIGYDNNGHYKLSLKDLNDDQSPKINKIQETSNGFNGLADNLAKWVNDTISEIEKKN